jgi:hypothetical protein
MYGNQKKTPFFATISTNNPSLSQMICRKIPPKGRNPYPDLYKKR